MRVRATVKRFLFASLVGRIILIPYRLWYTFRQGYRHFARYSWWLLTEREVTNFSYRLTERSKQELCSVVDTATGAPAGTAASHFEKFRNSPKQKQLVREIDAATARSPFKWSQNSHAILDQRVIYYLLVRSLKPKVVFQSGTARGVGACLIATALLENNEEGQGGRLISTDIDSEQGYAVTGALRTVLTFKAQDSVAALTQLSEPVDLYIHDTSPGLLAQREFTELEFHLAGNGFVLSTWHTATTEALARRLNRNYIVWQDEPAGHWYRGANMALICGLKIAGNSSSPS